VTAQLIGWLLSLFVAFLIGLVIGHGQREK
jgi:hypothetical protein